MASTKLATFRGSTSPVCRLAAAGSIGILELRAAAEIRDCAESVGASQTLRTMSYGERIDCSRRPTFALPGAVDLSTSFRHYRTWCAVVEANEWHLPELLGVIVLAIPARRLERATHLRSGTIGKLIVPALGCYVEISGWGALADDPT